MEELNCENCGCHIGRLLNTPSNTCAIGLYIELEPIK